MDDPLESDEQQLLSEEATDALGMGAEVGEVAAVAFCAGGDGGPLSFDNVDPMCVLSAAQQELLLPAVQRDEQLEDTNRN